MIISASALRRKTHREINEVLGVSRGGILKDRIDLVSQIENEILLETVSNNDVIITHGYYGFNIRIYPNNPDR